MSENQADLKKYYKDVVASKLIEKFQLNAMEVPRIEKITLNMGLGEAVADKKIVEKAVTIMEKIAAQKPVVTLAKKSVAGFKIRELMPIGCKVTLRNTKMYDFLTRFLSISIPAIRDFRGLNTKSFDGRGNFSMGVTDIIIFPEMDFMNYDKVMGMDICVTTSAKNDEQARELLKEMKFPFKR